MRMKTIVTAMLAACAVVVMSAVPQLAAQTPQQPHHAADTTKPPTDMVSKDQAMMAEREKMMTAMKAADQRLDDLVATMNAASGMEKMAATAAVVTDIVTERRMMRDGMMKMQEGMMSHMMEHMQAGPASMASCPMMKPMGDMKP